MDRGAWQAIVQGVAKNQVQLSSLSLSQTHTQQTFKNELKCPPDF